MHQSISGFFLVQMPRPGVLAVWVGELGLKSTERDVGICTISRTPYRVSVVHNWIHMIKKRHYYNDESVFVYE